MLRLGLFLSLVGAKTDVFYIDKSRFERDMVLY